MLHFKLSSDAVDWNACDHGDAQVTNAKMLLLNKSEFCKALVLVNSERDRKKQNKRKLSGKRTIRWYTYTPEVLLVSPCLCERRL
jgi:hypothetical protein